MISDRGKSLWYFCNQTFTRTCTIHSDQGLKVLYVGASVLLAWITADAVGQRAQLSPWVSLKGHESEDHRSRPLDCFNPALFIYTYRTLHKWTHLTFLGLKHKALQLVTICKCHMIRSSDLQRCQLYNWYIMLWIRLFVVQWGYYAGVLEKTMTVIHGRQGPTYWEQWEGHYCTIPQCHNLKYQNKGETSPFMLQEITNAEQHCPSSAESTRLKDYFEIDNIQRLSCDCLRTPNIEI